MAWLEAQGLCDEDVTGYVRGPTSVPYPTESYPWLEILQLDASALERGARWLQDNLEWSPEEVSRALQREPHVLLTAVTASGASPGSPRPGYPLPTPVSNWRRIPQDELA